MISVTELRIGRIFLLGDQLLQVIEYKHTKMGRGTANIRVKVRDLITGATVGKTFISGARVEEAITQARNLQYLYKDDQGYFFMDPRTFEQFTLEANLVGDKAKYLKESEEVKISFWEDKPILLELPNWLIFTVIESPPGVKGNTVSALTKVVKLDNGLSVKAPLFIKVGEKIKVDTRTGSYLGRA